MEHFEGISQTIHASNGYVSDLLEAWILICERTSRPPERDSILQFLKSRLALGDGGRSWRFYPLDNALNLESLRQFAEVLADCALLLSADTSELLQELRASNCLHPSRSNKDHRLRIVATNLNLFELVCEVFDHEGMPVRSFPALPLSSQDMTMVHYHVMSARLVDLRKRDLKEKLVAAFDKAIELQLSLESPVSRGVLYDLYSEQAGLLEKLGRPVAAADAYEKVAALEQDMQMRSAILDYVAELRSYRPASQIDKLIDEAEHDPDSC